LHACNRSCLSACWSHRCIVPIKMPLGWLSRLGPKTHVIDGVKIGRIHSQPQRVRNWRRSLLANYCGPLSYIISVSHLAHMVYSKKGELSNLPRPSNSFKYIGHNERQDDSFLQQFLGILQVCDVIPVIENQLHIFSRSHHGNDRCHWAIRNGLRPFKCGFGEQWEELAGRII